VELRVGPALQSLAALGTENAGPFDLIFIDADKPGYSKYLDLSLELSRPGTVILADNLIRDGAVLAENPDEDNARAARAFNAKLAAHPRLESIITPVMGKRIDGMSISIVR
jgi:predicted O-methyltransferase YrrM